MKNNYLLLFICLFSCKQSSSIIVENNFYNADSTYVSIKVNEDKIASKYFKRGITSHSYEEIIFQSHFKDTITVFVELANWNIKTSKTYVGDFSQIFVSVYRDVNMKFLNNNNSGSGLENRDSILIPKISIDFK